MKLPWLHIRPQNWSHDLVEMVGTSEGLEAAKAAIETAIQTKSGECCLYASDGEGYPLRIRRSSTLSGLGDPFYLDDVTDRMARSRMRELISHHRLIERQNSEAMEALRWCRANGNPHAQEDAPTTPKDPS
mgnify:CR=1 FL=1